MRNYSFLGFLGKTFIIISIFALLGHICDELNITGVIPAIFITGSLFSVFLLSLSDGRDAQLKERLDKFLAEQEDKKKLEEKKHPIGVIALSENDGVIFCTNNNLKFKDNREVVIITRHHDAMGYVFRQIIITDRAMENENLLELLKKLSVTHVIHN